MDDKNDVTLSVDISGLSAGTYEATITISAPEAINGPVEVNVTLTVVPRSPEIALNRIVFAFSGNEGQPLPLGDQVLQVSNTGDGTLEWTASVSEDATWLSLSALGGASTGADDKNDVTLSVDVSGLSADTYRATITITAPEANISPVETTVVLTLGIPPDSDSDGVIDLIEDGAPNGGDGNNDGTPDREQANVTSLPNAVNGAYVTVSTEGGTFAEVRAVQEPPGEVPSFVVFSVGHFEFTAIRLDPGDSTDVTINLHDGEGVNTYYLYGPTPDLPDEDHWYEFRFDNETNTGATFDGNIVTLHFKDGERGHDLKTRGIISALGGPGRVEFRTDLALSVTGPSESITVVQNAGFSITVTNDGPATATDVTLTIEHPQELTPASVIPDQGTCEGEGVITCDLGDLTDGESVAIALVMQSSTGGENLTITATTAGSGVEPNEQNNSDSASVTITAPDMSLSQSRFEFTSVEGNHNPDAQEFVISNPGTGMLNWLASTTCNATGEQIDQASWLRLSPGGGGIGPEDTQSVSVSVDTLALAPGTHEAELILSAPGDTNDCQKLSIIVTILVADSVPSQTSVNLAAWELSGLSEIVGSFFEAQKPSVEGEAQQQWLSRGVSLASMFASDLIKRRPIADPGQDGDSAESQTRLSLLGGALASWGPQDDVPDAVGQFTFDVARAIAGITAGDETQWDNLGILRIEETSRETLFIAYSRSEGKVLVHLDIFDDVAPGQIDIVIPVAVAQDEETSANILVSSGEGTVFIRRLLPMLKAEIQSSGELQVYDKLGRVTGMVNGKPVRNIPGSTFINGSVLVLLPSESKASSYKFEITGTKVGPYDIRITLIRTKGTSVVFEDSDDTAPGEVDLYSIDWDAYAQDDKTGWSKRTDVNGDGRFGEPFPQPPPEPERYPWVWPESVIAASVGVVLVAIIIWLALSGIVSNRLGIVGKGIGALGNGLKALGRGIKWLVKPLKAVAKGVGIRVPRLRVPRPRPPRLRPPRLRAPRMPR